MSKTADAASATAAKPAPRPTPETSEFWDGCAAGELRIQRCSPCGAAYFYPRPFCPRCLSDDVEWVRASGRARLYSYVINHRPAPGFADDAPYAIAVVELEEGPRMMTNIVGIENTPENLVLDMPLRVRFEPRGEVSLPMFEPDVSDAREATASTAPNNIRRAGGEANESEPGNGGAR